MDDTIPLEDSPNSVPKTINFIFKHVHSSSNSIKSTQPVDNCEMNEELNFSYKQSYEAIDTDVDRRGISREGRIFIKKYSRKELVATIRPNLRSHYEDLFLNQKNSNRLINYYFTEKCALQHSDANEYDFSIKSVLLRLKSGYKVIKYNYSLNQTSLVFIKIEDSMLFMKGLSKCNTRLPFDCIYGVVIGCETMTFKLFKPKIDKIHKILTAIHKSYNCFSIITDMRSYDLATSSDLARQDICIGVSWLSFHYGQIHTCIPYSKSKFYVDTLTLMIVSLKLHEFAKERYMSIVELFLLAICKTLREMKKKYEKVLEILEKRYTNEGKISRFIMRSIVSSVREQHSKSTLKANVRVSLLANKPLAYNEKKLPDCSEIVRKKRTVQLYKQTYIPFFVPITMSAYEKPRLIKEAEKSVQFSRSGTLKLTSTIKHININ